MAAKNKEERTDKDSHCIVFHGDLIFETSSRKNLVLERT